MNRTISIFLAIGVLIALAGLLLTECGSTDDLGTEPETDTPSTIPVDDRGFPTEWPVLAPPGTVVGCPNGQVAKEALTFSVVLCLPNDPDPLTVATQYVDDLQADGFVEREPGAFDADQLTFMDGRGIEILVQLIGDEATIVLIKPF